MENREENNCIFCKIINKTLPAFTVYEDDNFLAFLDIHPIGPGHIQVIPKKHYRYVWDLPQEIDTPDNTGEYFKIVQKIALAQKKAFNADIVRSQIHGEEIYHAHIWVWPEVPGELMNLEENAKKILEALK